MCIELLHTATSRTCNLQITSMFVEIFALPIMAGLIVADFLFYFLGLRIKAADTLWSLVSATCSLAGLFLLLMKSRLWDIFLVGNYKPCTKSTLQLQISFRDFRAHN